MRWPSVAALAGRRGTKPRLRPRSSAGSQRSSTAWLWPWRRAPRATRVKTLKTPCPLLTRAGFQRVILVTHDLHMPRALRAFKNAVGAESLEIVPAPLGMNERGYNALTDWCPSDAGLRRVRALCRVRSPGKADRALSRVQKEKAPPGRSREGGWAWPPLGAPKRLLWGSWRAKIAPAGLPDRPLEIRSGTSQLQGRSWGGVCPNSVSNSASARARTASGRWITRPHSRSVSPGHLLVASSPILPPMPL